MDERTEILACMIIMQAPMPMAIPRPRDEA